MNRELLKQAVDMLETSFPISPEFEDKCESLIAKIKAELEKPALQPILYHDIQGIYVRLGDNHHGIGNES